MPWTPVISSMRLSNTAFIPNHDAMAAKILLDIDANTLKPDNRNHLMRTGSLSSLKKLADNGVVLTGNLEELGSNILQLFAQEDIPFSTENSSGTNIKNLPSITLGIDDDGKLVLTPESGDAGESYRCDDWISVVRYLLLEHRSVTHIRKTGETDISVTVQLDGTGKSRINTGIPFFDHMLEQIARHGYINLDIECRGDLEIDEHHTIEDTAITLGEAIGMALGNKRGIGRYGFMTAMDETRSQVIIDLSGRPWCVFEGSFRREKVGDFPTEMTSHFFHSFAMSLKATLHVFVKGENDHHQIEACFKGLARSLRHAVDRNEKYLDILPSSKGLL